MIARVMHRAYRNFSPLAITPHTLSVYAKMRISLLQK